MFWLDLHCVLKAYSLLFLLLLWCQLVTVTACGQWMGKRELLTHPHLTELVIYLLAGHLSNLSVTSPRLGLSLLYPQQLKQCLERSVHSINIYWILNEFWLPSWSSPGICLMWAIVSISWGQISPQGLTPVSTFFSAGFCREGSSQCHCHWPLFRGLLSEGVPCRCRDGASKDGGMFSG